MKQLISLGTAVDSGTGDYLRRGGDKINQNFNQIYEAYGDGQNLSPATNGWEQASTDFTADWGLQYDIDTSAGAVTVTLPTGNSGRYGSGISFRDPRGTWNKNPVTFVSSGGDIIDSTSSVSINVRFSLFTMIYSTPNAWRWRSGQRFDRFSDTAEASIFKRSVKVGVDDETDFSDPLPVEYNADAFDVYVNGHMLYYGGIDDPDTQYGSYEAGNPSIIDLNGVNVRILYPLSAGDIITFVSYQKSVGISPTSYVERSLKVRSSGSGASEIAGKQIIRNLGDATIDIAIADFATSNLAGFQKEATEVYVNGQKLIRRGTADYSAGSCSDSQYTDEASCTLNGGSWTDAWDQYGLVQDGNGFYTTLRIHTSNLTDGDVVSFVTYNSIVGSVLSLEDILTETNAQYPQKGPSLEISNRLSYSNPNNPSNGTAQVNPSSENISISSLSQFFDLIYAVGTIYENAHNPANPRDYLGFGTWVKYASGRFLAGHDDQPDGFGSFDPIFGENPDDLDGSNNPRITAGGRVGQRSVGLTAEMIPRLSSGSANVFLKKNPSSEAGFLKYWGSGITALTPIASYDEAQVQLGTTSPEEFNIIPPTTTVYRWLRVE